MTKNAGPIGPYLPGLNDTLENGVYVGDSHRLALDIPDHSVDCIWTDPEYQKVEDYFWLAQLAKRVLKPNGHLVTFYGIGYTLDTFAALKLGGFPVTWPLVIYQPGQNQRTTGGIFANYNALVWCANGNAKPHAKIADVQSSYVHQVKGPEEWRWRKNATVIAKWLPAFCKPGGVVLDVFAGFCAIPEACIMTGRKYLAFEFNEEKVEVSRRELRKVQPTMFAADGDDGFKNMTIFDVLDSVEPEPEPSQQMLADLEEDRQRDLIAARVFEFDFDINASDDEDDLFSGVEDFPDD